MYNCKIKKCLKWREMIKLSNQSANENILIYLLVKYSVLVKPTCPSPPETSLLNINVCLSYFLKKDSRNLFFWCHYRLWLLYLVSKDIIFGRCELPRILREPGSRVSIRCSVDAEHKEKNQNRCRHELFPWDVQVVLVNDICCKGLFWELLKYSITGTC